MYSNLDEVTLCETVQHLSPTHNARLLETSISNHWHTNIIKPIIKTSYEGDTLGETLSYMVTIIDALSASDYFDDCMIYSFPTMEPSEILSIARFLQDNSFITGKQEAFWMIVAFDRKDQCDLSQSLFESLYPNNDTVYFSITDFRNLDRLLSNQHLKALVSQKLEHLVERVVKIEKLLKQRNHGALLSACGNSVAILEENNLVAQIVANTGCHFTALVLATFFPLSRNTHQLELVVRQLEGSKSYSHLATFVTYYGFLFPEELRSYTEGKMRKVGIKLKKNYPNIKHCQMYLYSYLVNRQTDVNWQHLETVSASFGWTVLKELSIAYCIVYKDIRFIISFLQKYSNNLNNTEKELLLIVKHNSLEEDYEYLDSTE